MNKYAEFIRNKRKFGFSAIALLVILFLWSVLLFYIRPSEIIDSLGITNLYLMLFIGGILGGISLFIPFPNYLFVFTFGAAGINPFIIGFVAGLGTIIGECTSYFFGHSAHSLLPNSADKFIYNLRERLINRPKWFAPLVFFIWGAVFPLPNDFLLVPFGVIRYPFWRIIIPLGLGNILFNILIAFAGYYGLTGFF